MLIRKPVAEVFEAFVDPDITAKFWFTKGSGRLERPHFTTFTPDARFGSRTRVAAALDRERIACPPNGSMTLRTR